MKKLTLQSNFHEEDGMFFHNKVFRIMHGYLRHTQNVIQIGISDTCDALYFYASEAVINDFLSQKDIQDILFRNVYEPKVADALAVEPILIRTSIFNPKAKAKAQHKYYLKKFNGIDEAELGKKADVNYLEAHYKSILEAQKDVYFSAHKDGLQFSIFAQRALLDPRATFPNTYGLGKRSSLASA